MIKKWFAAGALGTALTLGACGGDTTEVNEENEQTTSTETEEEATETEEETTEAEIGTRSNPVPVGETREVEIVIYDNDSNAYAGQAELTVNSVTRGEEAWEHIHSTNEFNDEPAEGQEYLIADVTATLLEAETEDYPWFMDGMMYFNFISSDGSPYEWTSVVVESDLSGEIYAGGTLKGKVTNMVNENDDILLVFEDGNWDNVFFATE